MEVFGLYLLKVSAILLLFRAIYGLFLQKETTFVENRFFLLFGMLAAIFLPFLKIKRTVFVELTPTVPSNAFSSSTFLDSSTAVGSINWMLILFLIYTLGCLIFLLRFMLQLKSIKRLSKHAHIWKEEDLMHVETKERIAPFSFFKSLFYNPNQFKDAQLQAILIHEKVHARQWHSLDVICCEVMKILLWFNPLTWLYQRTVQQNLEFLADAQAVGNFNKTSYQYLMVNQATGHQIAITNSFYNSLIKKRIVMLNKNRSKQINVLKTLLVIPLLTLFMVSFSTETRYQFKNGDDSSTIAANKKVELQINKNTSDEELMKMKNDLAAEGVDLSYTTVRNDAKEIIDISVEVTGEGQNGASFKNSHSSSDSANGISPLIIIIDLENSLASIMTKGDYKTNVRKITSSGSSVWISSGDDEHQEIIIKEKDGAKKIFIDGEEVDEEDLHEHDVNVFIHEDEDDSHGNFSFHISSDDEEKHEKRVKITKKKSKGGGHVTILRDSDDDSDIDVIDEAEGFFFIDSDGKDPLYVIDGKEASKKEVKKLSPKDIESIEVRKGKGATKKYGKKAKDGVVEITLKS